jgi:hypothetical protein
MDTSDSTKNCQIQNWNSLQLDTWMFKSKMISEHNFCNPHCIFNCSAYILDLANYNMVPFSVSRNSNQKSITSFIMLDILVI